MVAVLDRVVAPDHATARHALREQLSRLERELAALERPPAAASAAARPGRARLLSVGELERARDALTARLAHARALQAERGAAQEAARVRLEGMLLAPARHRFERLPASALGEGGCGVYAVRPRLGLIGMLMGWWQVKLSSGCPLPG
jgi:hypothetical protein